MGPHPLLSLLLISAVAAGSATVSTASFIVSPLRPPPTAVAAAAAASSSSSYLSALRRDANADDDVGVGSRPPPRSPQRTPLPSSRKKFLSSVSAGTLAAAASALSAPRSASAAEENGLRSTADAEITDRIFVELKGLSSAGSGSTTSRIVIGLFGKDAPQPVSALKGLCSSDGLPAKCKPRETRMLQKEQLEVNKVYNSCVENEDTTGVNYDYATVWRIDKGRRIDLGAVAGRFVARINPTFEDAGSGLRHDAFGVVSVVRGDTGGFGFTVYTGDGGAREMDEDNVVVGRVLEGEGMDVVRNLNEAPVVQSSAVNYMGLTGGPTVQNAPIRSCRYGGPMYCNELKPLKKLLIVNTGIVS